MTEKKYILNHRANYLGITIKHFPKPQAILKDTNSIPQNERQCSEKICRLFGCSDAQKELWKQLNFLAKEPNLFLSLFCPNVNKPHEALLRNFRRNFIKSFICHFPESWGFWRIKPHQTEGRPRYHMLIYVDPAHVPAIDTWIRDRWFKNIGENGDDDFRIVDVRNLNALKKVKLYMVSDELPVFGTHWSPLWKHGLGQRWDCFGAKNIPFLEKTGVEITKKQYEQIRDLIIASLEKEIADLRAEQISAPYPRAFVLTNMLAEKQKYLKDIRKGRCTYYPNDPVLNAKIELIFKG